MTTQEQLNILAQAKKLAISLNDGTRKTKAVIAEIADLLAGLEDWLIRGRDPGEKHSTNPN